MFVSLLAQAGIENIDSDQANICPVCDVGDGRVHKGPNPESYNRWVQAQLSQFLGLGFTKTQLAELFRSQMRLMCAELNSAGNVYRNMITVPQK